MPYRSKDGEDQEDAGSEVFRYILCAVCPVKPKMCIRDSVKGVELLSGGRA